MTAQIPQAEMRARTVGDIAAEVPGATAVFRSFKIDFCCNGNLTLAAAAAQRRALDIEAVEEALASLVTSTAEAVVPMDSVALIDHIESRYHQAHRRALPELIALSRKVEAVHRGHPKVPAGLCCVLQRMEAKLESHMAEEERELFPAMRQQALQKLDAPILRLRQQHDDHGALLRQMEVLTEEFSPPDEACRSWQALYVGVAQLAEDLMEHIHLENNVLFPRFAAVEARI